MIPRGCYSTRATRYLLNAQRRSTRAANRRETLLSPAEERDDSSCSRRRGVSHTAQASRGGAFEHRRLRSQVKKKPRGAAGLHNTSERDDTTDEHTTHYRRAIQSLHKKRR